MIRTKRSALTCRLYCAVCVLLTVLVLSFILRGRVPAAAEDDRIGIAAAFLAENGWNADGSSAEIAQVLIPESFGAVYERYNEIQLAQGFDLRNYRGRRAVRITFSMAEYPGGADARLMRANILFCGRDIIAADICSVAADGFMHGVIRK